MAKKTAKLAASMIEKKIAQREQQIATALNEIIDTIEKYFTIAPFQWIRGDGEETGCHAFPDDVETPFHKFDPWADRWMGQLFPYAHEVQRKLMAKGDHSDEPGELAFVAEEFGFLCGVLVGSKTQGATRDELLDQCQGFIAPRMQWERRRITEAAEKQAKE